MEGIKGKRALVTGGASGMGLAVATKLLELEAQVFIVDRDKNKLEEVRKNFDNKITAIELDVSDRKATREVIKEILPIQLLVNNAGIIKIKTAVDHTDDDIDDTLAVNFKAGVTLIQIIAKDLSERNSSGNIVNFSSVAGKRAFNNCLAYCCSKAAVDMMTKCFALELGPKNIRVNGVNPAVIATTAMGKQVTDVFGESITIHNCPLERKVEIKDVVDAVLFVLSDNSRMINGHSLLIDGGRLVTS